MNKIYRILIRIGFATGIVLIVYAQMTKGIQPLESIVGGFMTGFFGTWSLIDHK